MEPKTETKRNRPFDAGKDNDPNLRDETASQPGMSTITSNEYSKENNSLTETASDDFVDADYGKGADKAFDDNAQKANE